MAGRLRVAVCPDFREERWPSMDRVADKLVEQLRAAPRGTIDVEAVCPPFRRRVTRVWGLRTGRTAHNVDRGLNRLIDYPRRVGALAQQYDVFHVVDHSYAQLVHRLPARRTVVTCHDLDTFRCLFEPGQEPRSVFFRSMTRRILSGLQAAAVVTCDTAAIRDELLARRLLAAERVVVVPVGVGHEYSPQADAEADQAAARLVSTGPGSVEILHVGSTIPRKRIDLVLKIVAVVRREDPRVRLIRVGGALTAEQSRLAGELGLTERVTTVSGLDDRMLAALYRRAALVIQPSEREGFGFPVVEAMRCGTPVVASDLPVLREVGGGAAEYCPVGDLEAWTRTLLSLLRARDRGGVHWDARRAMGRMQAERFTWGAFAATMADIYRTLAGADTERIARTA